MNIEQILRNPHLLYTKSHDTKAIFDYFVAKIIRHVECGQELQANSTAILQSIFKIQVDYNNVFELFSVQKYYTAWCLLERIEIAVKGVLRHYSFIEDEYYVLCIKEYVKKLQGLYPYKIFGSSEYVKKETRCSICDSIITLRKRCSHKKGELYMGEICTYIITKSEMIGMSIVDEPFNKYSVMGVTKDEDDPYKYKNIDFLLSVIDHPFNQWKTESYKIFEPHSKFSIPRNEPCPCGSELKYKKCCLPKPGVEMDHTQFIMKQPTMKTRGMKPTKVQKVSN